MNEKMPKPEDIENEEQHDTKSGNMGMNVLGAAALVGLGVAAVGTLNDEQLQMAAEHPEAVQGQVSTEFIAQHSADLQKYHEKINAQDAANESIQTLNENEIRIRAIEIAINKNLHISFDYVNGEPSLDEGVSYKTTKEGVPYDIKIGNNFVPYSPADYSEKELESLKAEAAK